MLSCKPQACYSKHVNVGLDKVPFFHSFFFFHLKGQKNLSLSSFEFLFSVPFHFTGIDPVKDLLLLLFYQNENTFFSAESVIDVKEKETIKIKLYKEKV